MLFDYGYVTDPKPQLMYVGINRSHLVVKSALEIRANSHKVLSAISIKSDITTWSCYQHQDCLFQFPQFLEVDPEVQRGKVSCPQQVSLW